ncbi:uncharacterized protein DNG_08123 [Cephalotrichum gorgonifer]|uniref:Protein kinase domain-containing protein n=1 Tax=Cephalotrichum gorgonifer TaxID=2041049 RepID=A0AAE8N2W5_9PEZI|nr:uncharacterized protein DNG_08123 [Cephalotrichum gorgonifer]
MGAIEDFICPDSGVSDDDLPLASIFTDDGVELRKENGKSPSCFKEWHSSSLESFERYQYEVCPHIFSITDKTKAPHFDLEPEVILPFLLPGGEIRERLPSDDRIGAFGELHLKEEGGIFAVKKLHKGKVNDWKLFKHEADQLQKFNGRTSPHIVTLLATFSQDGEHFFIFPFAEADLCKYWETKSPPRHWEFTRWYADQLSGLIEAIFSIHFPNSSDSLQPGQGKFGRHGDIKPDNILWFKSTSHAQGLFVVSDLGLSALNSDKSKSNIPGQNVPPVPGYRPPECDIEQAKVSRLFDVWTMGCLYLEMITWYLGGEDLRLEFENRRTTTFLITGGLTNQFYNLEASAEGQGMFIQFIKPEVTKWIHRLRRHEACTEFVHDLIDIIERDMIVILADPPKRADSRKLKRLFGNVREKCKKSRDYCELPAPRSIPRHLNVVKEGVCVRLDPVVVYQMSNHQQEGQVGQRVFKGNALRSARPEQYQDAE